MLTHADIETAETIARIAEARFASTEEVAALRRVIEAARPVAPLRYRWDDRGDDHAKLFYRHQRMERIRNRERALNEEAAAGALAAIERVLASDFDADDSGAREHVIEHA